MCCSFAWATSVARRPPRACSAPRSCRSGSDHVVREIRPASATGTSAQPPDRRAIQAARRRGYDLTASCARGRSPPPTSARFGWILAMDHSNLRGAASKCGRRLRRSPRDCCSISSRRRRARSARSRTTAGPTGSSACSIWSRRRARSLFGALQAATRPLANALNDEGGHAARLPDAHFTCRAGFSQPEAARPCASSPRSAAAPRRSRPSADARGADPASAVRRPPPAAILNLVSTSSRPESGGSVSDTGGNSGMGRGGGTARGRLRCGAGRPDVPAAPAARRAARGEGSRPL